MAASVGSISRLRRSASNHLYPAGSSPSSDSSCDSKTLVSETPPEYASKQSDIETGMISRGVQTTRLQEPIRHSALLELELLLLTFCTGLLDTATISKHGVFCSKQTGNIIFIALALVDLNPTRSQNRVGIITSLLAFIAGSAAYGWAGNTFGHSKRLWLLFGNFISAALILGAAILQHLASQVESFDTGQTSAIIVALCAIACGAQFSLSLNVRGPELNTSVVTSAIVSLTADARLFCVDNPGRNRRMLFFLTIACGAITGAALTKVVGPAYVMILDALHKIVIGLLFLTNPGAALNQG